METLWQDIRHGLRRLAGNPGFAAVVVLILAVGIGANTAVFSVINAVILRPLPYAQAHRLVMLMERPEKIETGTVHDRFFRWREQNQVFDHMVAFSGRRPYVTGIDRPRYLWGVAASSDLFPLLGIQPLLGRGFLPEEEQPGHDRVIVLSHSFWQDDLGGTPDAIGKTVILDGASFTIIGVMPPNFMFPVGIARAFWVPLVYQRTSDWPSGGLVLGLARLKKECTLEQARAAMDVIAARLKQTDPEAGAIAVQRLLDRKLGANRQLLWLLLGAAGFVLLIACTNVVSLLLARATVRQREMALRVALGAPRTRLLRQMLTESLLLSLGGGVLGLLVTFGTVKGIVRLCPANIPRLEEVSVDGAVLAFTLGVSVLTGLVFGVIPACRASDVRVSRVLKEGQTRSSTGRGWRRLHGGLVIAQMSLSLILLIGAALLIRTWMALQKTDLGFRPEKVLSVDIHLRESTYPDYASCQGFFEPLLQRVRALPGVRAVAVTPFLDFGIDAMKSPFTIAGQAPVNPEDRPYLKRRGVTPDFFETLGMRLLKGRSFTPEDMQGTTHSAIIDKNLARQYFADTDPIGQTVHTKDTDYSIEGEDVDYTIVGVVGTLKDFRHLDPALGTLYHPQNKYWRDMVLVVRTDGDPLRLAGAIRAQVAELEKDDVVTEVETLEANLSGLLAPRRFSMVLLGLFAGIALTLAAVGIYGLLQYSTAQQTHDVGIRMALGARRADVLKAVLGRGLRLTLIGVALGLVGAYALTRLLASLLYGVPPTDPLTFVGVSLVLVAVALLASYLPARRAARIDPMAALRYE
jgi:putative ABC transport system permease protein